MTDLSADSLNIFCRLGRALDAPAPPRSVAPWAYPRPSGNRAFDEYRAETLRLLEEEQRDFRKCFDRLRHAEDKAEFDQFTAERRNRPLSPLRP